MKGRRTRPPHRFSRIDARRDDAAAAAAAKETVLFVCSHNSARSQIAEAVLRREAGDRFVVRTYSPMRTIGGGTIVAPVAEKRRRFKGAAGGKGGCFCETSAI